MSVTRIIPYILLFILTLSCTREDKQSVKRDIDTVKNKVTEKVKEILPGDTLFNNVVVTEVSVSKNVSKNLHDNLSDVFDHYLAIKNNLADNDSVDTRKHAYEMLDVVMKASEDAESKIDKKWTLVGDKLMQYRKIIENSETLAEQREWFSKLTASLTDAIQKYGIPDKTVYELHSINSDNDKSDIWLTDSKDSDNPYTGDGKDESSIERKVVVRRGWEFN